MTEVLYWLARIGLVLGWLAVAIAALPVCGRRIAFLGVALAALLFASMRALRWNYGLLERARMVLLEYGVYDDRMVGKIGLALLLGVAIAIAVVALRRVADRHLRLALAGVGLQATLVLVETLSLDDAMPRWLVAQPGRYLAEGAFLAVVVAGVVAARPTPAGPR